MAGHVPRTGFGGQVGSRRIRSAAVAGHEQSLNGTRHNSTGCRTFAHVPVGTSRDGRIADTPDSVDSGADKHSWAGNPSPRQRDDTRTLCRRSLQTGGGGRPHRPTVHLGQLPTRREDRSRLLAHPATAPGS